jgi:hypothetical protein
LLARLTKTLFLSMAVLGLVGMFIGNVAPSLLVQRVAVIGSIAMAAYFFVAWFKPPNAFVPKWDEQMARRSRLLRSSWRRAPFMAAIGLMMAYISLSTAWPWLYTSAFGHAGEAYFVVSGWESFRGQCARPRLEEMPFLLFSRRTFCFGDELRGKVPVGTVIRITGQQSALGIIPERLFIVANKTLEPMR